MVFKRGFNYLHADVFMLHNGTEAFVCPQVGRDAIRPRRRRPARHSGGPLLMHWAHFSGPFDYSFVTSLVSIRLSSHGVAIPGCSLQHGSPFLGPAPPRTMRAAACTHQPRLTSPNRGAGQLPRACRQAAVPPPGRWWRWAGAVLHSRLGSRWPTLLPNLIGAGSAPMLVTRRRHRQQAAAAGSSTPRATPLACAAAPRGRRRQALGQFWGKRRL